MPATTLLDALAGQDARALGELVAEDVRFRSPAADYAGRDDVVHLLATIGGVVSDVRPTRTLVDGRSTTTFLTALLGDGRCRACSTSSATRTGASPTRCSCCAPTPCCAPRSGPCRRGWADDPLPSARP